MKVTLVGSRFFGASVLEALRKLDGVQIAGVVAPADDDRLAGAARAASLPLHVTVNPKIVPGEAIPEGTDLIVAAHTHARVSNEALARARLGGVGYHPSLLPRHRGIAAVEWTILSGDPIAGGSVYHLADGWDRGALAAQDWCFVKKGEGARELWERALAPMGLALIGRVVQHAQREGALPAMLQDEAFATKAPMIRRPEVTDAPGESAHPSLVVTLIGPDRPGIVNQVSERAERFGANWTTSHLAREAGEFAGIVHLKVPAANADTLAQSLRDLEANDLHVMVTRSSSAHQHPTMRSMQLRLHGEDRVGIVAKLTAVLAGRGVSIESLQTALKDDATTHRPRFEVSAHLAVPASLNPELLQTELDQLAQALMLDAALQV